MLQDPSLGLCSAQTSGSSVTLISANAAASAIGDVEPECVKPSPLAFGAPISLYQQPINEATPPAPPTGLTFGGAGTLLDGGRPCARRLELNEKDDEAAPKEGEEAKEEDAWVDYAAVGAQTQEFKYATEAVGEKVDAATDEDARQGEAQGTEAEAAATVAAAQEDVARADAPKSDNRSFYYPDLLRAACHFCNHLPAGSTMQDIVNRFPFTATGRLNVPPHDAAIYLRDMDMNRAPKGLSRRRKGRTPVVSKGAAYLARQTLAFLSASIDTDMAKNIWEWAATGQTPRHGLYAGGSRDDLELREVARDVLLQRATAERRAAPEWEAAMTDAAKDGAQELQGYAMVAKWLDNATAWQMESRQRHGTCRLPGPDLFADVAPTLPPGFQPGRQVKVHSLQHAAQHNGQQGTLIEYADDVTRWVVELTSGEHIRVRPHNLEALNHLHPLLLTPTPIDDPANLWCLPPGPLWWSNSMLDLLEDFYRASEESSRAGARGGLTFKPPAFTPEPGQPTDPSLGMPWSMRIINGRRLRTVGDRRNLSPDERAYLADQNRCWTNFGWPGRDKDRRPAWRPRPAEGFPVLDGLICALAAPALIRCPALIRLLRNQWTQDGWEDPFEDQEDTGHDAATWDAYGLFGDDEFEDYFRGD